MFNPRRSIYRPFTLSYFLLLWGLLALVMGYYLSFLRGVLVDVLGLPEGLFPLLAALSLVGSNVNIPVALLESPRPVVYVEHVNVFGVRRLLPRFASWRRETLVMVNVGGALVPLLISLYLLVFNIPAHSPRPLYTLLKTLLVLLVVALNTNRISRVVEGLGVTTPAWGPPAITALTVLALDLVSPLHCPLQVAYIGGTLGVLLGADIMNLRKIVGVGPVVSIGGAGTFDGVYLTGLMSVVLLALTY